MRPGACRDPYDQVTAAAKKSQTSVLQLQAGFVGSKELAGGLLVILKVSGRIPSQMANSLPPPHIFFFPGATVFCGVVGSLGVLPTTSVIQVGISPVMWVSLWEALIVVSRKWVISHSPVSGGYQSTWGLLTPSTHHEWG